MKKNIIKLTAYTTAFMMMATGMSIEVYASPLSEVLPSAGIEYTLGSKSTSLSDLQIAQDSVEANKSEEEKTIFDEAEPSGVADASAKASLLDIVTETESEDTTNHSDIEDTIVVSKGYMEDLLAASGSKVETEEDQFRSLVIAQVTNYVNVRDIPSEEGEIVGKLYNNSVGNFIEEKDGWYKISSGSVEGYVKGEFCVTGVAAVDLAKKVGTRIAKVNTTTLFVREEATTESDVIGMVPDQDELIVLEELDGWVKINIEEGDGYVSTDYVILSTEFVKAESKAEEEARLAKERAEQEAARAAAAAAEAARNSKNKDKSDGGKYKDTGNYAPAGSGTGANVASFACQFVGNPYVYGGTSLTNGADCSGFVMSVYKNFGVNLPHSSSADRSVGATVGSLEEAQPGDIICYSGHVALYIGNGQIVHASTSRTGIIISNASYRSILSIRRIF